MKFAIIGCGRIAQRHAEHIKNTQVAQLTMCYDIVAEKAEQLAKEHDAAAAGSLEEMLKSDNVDIVSICSPNGLHAAHSISSLNAGKHVLCEKPMAISAYDCGEMIQAAERNNKRLFVIKQNRFNPPVAAVKELIVSGQLGKVFSVQLSCFWNRNENYYLNSWKGSKELDGGTLFTQFSHFVDLLYFLVGDVKEVRGFGDNFNDKDTIEFEDTGVVALKFHSGALGTINYTVNSYPRNMEGSLTIFAEKGTIKIGGQYLNELEYFQVKGIDAPPELEVGNKANNYGEYQGSMSNHDKIYQNVVEVMNSGASISTNMFEGLKTVEIIEKIYDQING